MSKLTKELGCSVTLFPNFCVLQELYNGKVRVVGKEAGCLYTQNSGSDEKNILLTVTQVSSNMELWDQRLGHVSSVVLAKMFDLNINSMCKVSNV